MNSNDYHLETVLEAELPFLHHEKLPYSTTHSSVFSFSSTECLRQEFSDKSLEFVGKRQSSNLTVSIIQQIKNSISNFKPSRSLAQIVKPTSNYRSQMFSLIDQDEYDNVFVNDQHYRSSTSLNCHSSPGSRDITAARVEIDLVISGGGLKGYYMTGCAGVLLKQLEQNHIRIARIAGASAGAWVGLFILCGVTTYHWIETFHMCRERPSKLIHEVYEEIKPWLYSLMPVDAYKMCCGRLFISITVLTWSGPENRIISEFYSNDDLFECCFASSTIPYMTERPSKTNNLFGCRRFRGDVVVDGGLTNNCPVFPDGIRRQLVFRLYEVEYPFRLLVNARDTCIDALVIRGALLMARFLQGEPTDSIAWLEQKSPKSSLRIRPNYYFRMVMVPFVVGGLIFSRSTGLSYTVDLLKSILRGSMLNIRSLSNDMQQVVPFEEAAQYFSLSPLRYALGALLGAIFDQLGSMNLLL